MPPAVPAWTRVLRPRLPHPCLIESKRNPIRFLARTVPESAVRRGSSIAALTNLIAVDQFQECRTTTASIDALWRDDSRHPHPKRRCRLRRRLVKLSMDRMLRSWHVGMKFPYRPVAEFDLRVADVVVVSPCRYDRIDPDDDLRRAPELRHRNRIALPIQPRTYVDSHRSAWPTTTWSAGSWTSPAPR